MADAVPSDLKQIVLKYRVTELIKFLSNYGQPQQGLKATLQARVLEYISNNLNFDVINKVRQIGMAVSNKLELPPPPKQAPIRSAFLPPKCPDVRFKKLPFYDTLGTIVPPTSLLRQSLPHGMNLMNLNFSLTPTLLNDVIQNRCQIQLRFCLLETTCEQNDHLPSKLDVLVNGQTCRLPELAQTKVGSGLWVKFDRLPEPIDITSHVNRFNSQLMIRWSEGNQRSFAFGLFAVRKLTSADLLQRLRSRGVKLADFTRALIQEKLREDPDSEVATTMLKVSLQCPLGRMRMQTPCRATTCNHLQCFDAVAYLQMNEKKSKWICPVCDRPALFSDLIVDGYFQAVLDSDRLLVDDKEIQLLKDGSWNVQRVAPETVNVSMAAKDVFDIFEEETSSESGKSDNSVKLSSVMQKGKKRMASGPISASIDLTDSDSEISYVPSKRQMLEPVMETIMLD